MEIYTFPLKKKGVVGVNAPKVIKSIYKKNVIGFPPNMYISYNYAIKGCISKDVPV